MHKGVIMASTAAIKKVGTAEDKGSRKKKKMREDLCLSGRNRKKKKKKG